MGLKVADDIRTRMATVRTAIEGLEKAEEPSDEHVRTQMHTQLTDYLAEWDDLEAKLKPLEEQEQRIEAVRQRSLDPAARESGAPDDARDGDEDDDQADGSGQGSGGGSDAGGGRFRAGGPDFVRRQRLNPFADLDRVRTHMLPEREVRHRAVTAIEQFAKRTDMWALDAEAAENATRLVQRTAPRFAAALSEQILITGSPDYLQAFQQYLSDPGGFSARAAMSLTPANGGYLVPFTLDPTIILTNAGSANPWRSVATVKTTTTNDWNGVTSAGVSAEWTAEGIEAADASPTVGTLKITPQKADAYLFGSYEVLSDADLAQQMPELLADAKDRIEETAFAVGTGSGQPWGAITRGTTLAAVAGTAATGFTAADAYALQAALPARWRGPRANNVWVGNLTSINRGRNLPSFTGSTTPLVTDGPSGPLMLGKPFLESTSVVGVFANGAKVLAYMDARQYYIVDRVGMSVVYDPIVLGANRRPTGQGAWYAFWRTGADVSAATAIRVLTLTT